MLISLAINSSGYILGQTKICSLSFNNNFASFFFFDHLLVFCMNVLLQCVPLFCIVSEFKRVTSECYAMAKKDLTRGFVHLALYFERNWITGKW